MVQLVGRDRPVAQLKAEIDRTLTSHGGLVFVTGEAGIGKTSLVGEALVGLDRGQAWLVHATCWDREGAPGYWPWVQVLRSLSRTVDDRTMEDARAHSGGDLAVLLGEASLRSDGRTLVDDGFGVADAVTTLLITLSRTRPVVVILDDLHWSDEPSLRVLEFVARHGWFEQVLIVGTFRDDEIQRDDHPLRPSLLNLTSKAAGISLTGLDRPDVDHLLREATGSPLPDTLVDEVHRRTGGNPFFVDQTAQIWASTGTVDTVAPQVRDAVDRRLGLLPADLLGTLQVAAVLGPAFTAGLLADATGTDTPTTTRRLRQAAAARLLVTTDHNGGTNGGTWTFAHDLVREVLYTGLGPDTTRHHHAAALAALEGTGRSRPTETRPDPTDLAHHAYLGVPEVPPAVAAGHLRNAARAAGRRFAVEEEGGHLRRALELIPQDTPRVWAEVASDFAANLNSTGDGAAARRTLLEVADLARKVDDPEMLAWAALRFRGIVWLEHPASEDEATAVALVRDAYSRFIGELDPASYADDRFDPHGDRRHELQLSERILERARAEGDNRNLPDALSAHFDAIWRPGTARDRIALGTELSALSAASSDLGSQLFGAYITMNAQVEEGDPTFRHQGAHIGTLAQQIDAVFPCGVHLWTELEISTFQGRFEDSARALTELETLSGRIAGPDADSIEKSALSHQQRWAYALLQGRFDEALALSSTGAGRLHPQLDLLRAITLAERGDDEKARRLLDGITPETVLRWFEPLHLRLTAQVAAASGDDDRIQAAREALGPLEGRWLVMIGDVTHGPVAYWLGLLDMADGERDTAISRFDAAAAAADRMGARPWAVRARTDLAAALLAETGRPHAEGNVTTPPDLLDKIEAEAGRLGMRHQAARVAQLRAAATAATATATRPPSCNEFRREGDVWVLSYQDRTVHVPDAKGLRDLHTLLGRPGDDVAAADLFAPDDGAEVRVSRRLGGDAVLDEQAKAAYRRRLEELDGQIDRALDRGNDRRAAELDTERATLIEELRRATGLGGRARHLGSDAERARKAVSERIRDTLRRLDRRHPELADHLRATVATGNRCRYQPLEVPVWHL